LFGIKGHEAGLGVSGKDVGVELLNGEERLEETAFRENPAIGYRTEKATLVIIGGYGLGIEGVDVGVLSILRVEGENGGETLIAIDVPIELSLGVSALINADVIGIWKRRRADCVVAVVERLEKIEFAANERTRKGEMRREALDAMGTAIDPAEAWDRVLEEPLPLLTAAPGGDFDDATREAPVLRRERVGENPHRFDSSRGKTKRGLTGEWIADGNIVDEGGGLIGVATLDVDETVGTTENSGKKGKCFLKVIVEPNEGL
jgi:hypothetical protein